MRDSTEGTATDPLDREYAAGWAPDAGDKTRGEVVAVSKRDAGFGTYPIYTLAITDGYDARTKDGELVTDEIAIHAQREVLRRKLANAQVGVGDEVGVKYQGPPKGTGRSHRYRVLKYLPDGGHVETCSDPDDELDYDDDDAATAEALEAERDKIDAASSELHKPLEGVGRR